MSAHFNVESARPQKKVVPKSAISADFEIAFTNLIEGFVQQDTAPQAESTAFDSVAQISISKYIRRLSAYVVVQEEDFLIALILLDRVLCNSRMVLNYITFHCLFLISLTTAIKTRQDYHCSNKYYAEAGGVSLKRFNTMECAFLTLIDFDVYVDLPMMQKYCTTIATQFEFGETLHRYIVPEPAVVTPPTSSPPTPPHSARAGRVDTAGAWGPDHSRAVAPHADTTSSWGYSDEGCYSTHGTHDAASVASYHTAASYTYPQHHVQYSFWNM